MKLSATVSTTNLPKFVTHYIFILGGGVGGIGNLCAFLFVKDENETFVFNK